MTQPQHTTDPPILPPSRLTQYRAEGWKRLALFLGIATAATLVAALVSPLLVLLVWAAAWVLILREMAHLLGALQAFREAARRVQTYQDSREGWPA